MSDEIFTQIIFPPKIKLVEPIIPAIIPKINNIYENCTRKYIPIQVCCTEKGGMVLLMGCLRCDERNIPLESIFLTSMGC
jgi:hypothetical protein